MSDDKEKPSIIARAMLPWRESRWHDTVQTKGNPAVNVTPEKLREWAAEPMKGTPMVPVHQATLLELADRLERQQRGWLEAAVAWSVCASIHRTYAKGRDALFTTRQADYVRHEKDARAQAEKDEPENG